MKIKNNVFFALCFALISVSVVLAKTTPPSPAARTASTTSTDDEGEEGPPAPPGVPVDQNLFVLAGCAVLFGVYAIRKYDFIKKDSI